jgi:hypothetical protein
VEECQHRIADRPNSAEVSAGELVFLHERHETTHDLLALLEGEHMGFTIAGVVDRHGSGLFAVVLAGMADDGELEHRRAHERRTHKRAA